MKEVLLVLAGGAPPLVLWWLQARREDGRERERWRREQSQDRSEWRRRAYVALLAAGDELYMACNEPVPGVDKRIDLSNEETRFTAAAGEVLLAGPREVSELVGEYERSMIATMLECLLAHDTDKKSWQEAVAARKALIQAMQAAVGVTD